jgi:hypothetical protein
LFTFDEGLADKQAPFIFVVRPLVSALQALEQTEVDVDRDEPSGPDPDHIKALIEDAIVLLGNAHCRLNIWRQKRFAEYLTDVGKRTLKDHIPTDKYLFPEQFHNVINLRWLHTLFIIGRLVPNLEFSRENVKNICKNKYNFFSLKRLKSEPQVMFILMF